MHKRPAQAVKETTEVYRPGRPSAFLDTRVVYLLRAEFSSGFVPNWEGRVFEVLAGV